MSGASETAALDSPAPRRTFWSAALMPWLLMSPALLIAIAFFGLPILFMGRMSFNAHIDQRFFNGSLNLFIDASDEVQRLIQRQVGYPQFDQFFSVFDDLLGS